MAEIVWTEPALTDLDAIADFIALDNPNAAAKLVGDVFAAVSHLADYPDAGSWPQELSGSRYRQLVVPPCRVFCRTDRDNVLILHVMRSEQKLRKTRLKRP